MSCRRPKRRNAPERAVGSNGGVAADGWVCQSVWSSSNCAIVDLASYLLIHAMFDGLLDARNLDAYVVDGQPGNFGDLAVTERFQKQGNDQTVLVGKGRDGATKCGEAFGVFQMLMSGGAGVGDLGKGLGRAALAAIEEGGVDGDAIEPGVGVGVAAEGGEGVPQIGHDFLKKVVDIGGGVEVSEAESLDAGLVLMEHFQEEALSLGVVHRRQRISCGGAGKLTT